MSVSRTRVWRGAATGWCGVRVCSRWGGFAHGGGLSGALSAAVRWLGERARVHDRGKVLADGLLMLGGGGGGEACSDIEYLRAQPELFGDVASDSTLWRTLVGLDAQGAAALCGTRAGGTTPSGARNSAAAALRSRTSPIPRTSRGGPRGHGW